MSDPSLVTLSVREAASVLSRSERSIKRDCKHGQYANLTVVNANGGRQYRIPLTSLPESAQARYHIEQARRQPSFPGEQYQSAILQQAHASCDRRNAPGRPKLETAEQKHEAWDRFNKATKAAQDEATRRNRIMQTDAELRLAGLPQGTIFAALQEQFGESEATIRRWRAAIADQGPEVWAPLLLPGKSSGRPQCDISPEAWSFILKLWGTTSQQSAASCYEQAQRQAPQEGWTLPSLKVVTKRLNALPNSYKVLKRYGAKALRDSVLHQERDVSAHAPNDIWCSDGHHADVHVRFPDGSVGRPWIVAWMDVRTRYVLGYHIGKFEDAYSIMQAFHASAKTSGAIPDHAITDNGRGYASKTMTGGAPNRYRFKVREGEPTGILPLLGVRVHWAEPGHGQSKPIESNWRFAAQRLAKRNEFVGAYCGNDPKNKPAQFDPSKPADYDLFCRLFREELEAFNHRPHRGRDMNGQSPYGLYTTLINEGRSGGSAISKSQLPQLLLASKTVKLPADTRRAPAFDIEGNRYSCEALEDLPRNKYYTVRYNEDDLTEDVYFYDGDKLLCEVPIRERVGFLDAAAAKEHARNKRAKLRAERQRAKAIEGMIDARLYGSKKPPSQPNVYPAQPLPRAKVVTPVRFSQEPPDLSNLKPATAPSPVQSRDEHMLRLLGGKRVKLA